MTAKSTKKDASALQQPPSVWIVIVALVVLLGVVAGIAHHALTPPATNMTIALGLDKHPFPAWLNTDANQCGGDFTKLSPAEQQKVNALYPGSGVVVMHAAYAAQHQ